MELVSLVPVQHTASSLQIRKLQHTDMAFRGLHVEKVAYMCDTWNRNVYKKNLT
jgi:hypothetical protein